MSLKIDKYVWQKSWIHQGVVDFRSNQKSAKNVCQGSVSDSSEAFIQYIWSCETSHGDQSSTKCKHIQKNKSFLEAVILQVTEFQFGCFDRKFTVSAFPYRVDGLADFFTKGLSTGFVLFVNVALGDLLLERSPLAADWFEGVTETESFALGFLLDDGNWDGGWLLWHGLCVKIL